MTLNVAAADGEVSVRVLDVAGDELAACQPIEGDHLDAPLRCGADFRVLPMPVRLEVTLREATLYAIDVLE